MSKYAIDESKPHLGGNLPGGDAATWCPSAWDYIINKFNIKSVLDVGSGRGHAAEWFANKGMTVSAVDGLEENVKHSLYPADLHDLTEGPYIAKTDIDFINCIEVVEHIEEKFLDNLLITLCQGKYLLMTHAVPGQKGWHHVNCQPTEYWIEHLKKYNFHLLEEDSQNIRELAKNDGGKHIARNGMILEKRWED